jgi:hypothetical protein
LKNKKGRFLSFVKNRPVCSALSNATENTHYAELDVMAISGVFAANAARRKCPRFITFFALPPGGPSLIIRDSQLEMLE